MPDHHRLARHAATLVGGATPVALLLLAACSDATSPTSPSAAPSAARALATATPTATGAGAIVSGMATTACADIRGGGTSTPAAGTALQVYTCSGGVNQQFAVQTSGAITAYNGALCLDVAGGRANDGDAVIAYTCHGGANQQWTATAAGELRTAVNGKCLDAWGASAANGTRLIVYTCHGGANQRWTIAGAATPTPPPAAPPTTPSARWVTGYYVGYQRAQYPESSVDFSYMTHIVVGAVQATTTGGVTTDFYIDNVNGPAMARTLASRAHAAGRKAILMLGGAGYHDALVSATSNTYRATFVANLLRTMDSLGYDGIDVDWEPINTADKPQIVQFLRDLRAARSGIILTFPVYWLGANAGADTWYAQVAPLVDQMNMMSYQMADNWPGWVSWHSAALYGQGADHPSSISASATAYRAAGVPAAKLGIGVGTYGSCWRGPTAVLQPLAAGQGVVASDNAMSYANIMAQYYNSAAYRWDATARAGYLSFASPTGPQQCTLVSYEDPRSVAEKAAYVAAQGLGGTIVWTIGQGHLPSAAAGAQDPLLKAAYTAAAQ